MIEDVEITDNEFLRQFELEVGDNMARIEYALQDRKIFLTKYDMPEDMEDAQGNVSLSAFETLCIKFEGEEMIIPDLGALENAYLAYKDRLL